MSNDNKKTLINSNDPNFHQTPMYQHRGPPPPYDYNQHQYQPQPPLHPMQPQPPYQMPPSYDASMHHFGMMSGPNAPIGYQNPSAGMYYPPNYPNAAIPNQMGQVPMVPFQQQNPNPYGIPVAEFDAGARFNGKAGGSMTIPPPPPGCMPTPAQIAAMQGQAVALTQKKPTFF